MCNEPPRVTRRGWKEEEKLRPNHFKRSSEKLCFFFMIFFALLYRPMKHMGTISPPPLFPVSTATCTALRHLTILPATRDFAARGSRVG